MAKKKKEEVDNPQGDMTIKKKIRGDTGRFDIVKEIGELSNIPEVEYYFSQKLTEAKQKFQKKINQYRNLKRNLKNKKEGKKVDEISGFQNGLSKSMSYFFELYRVKDEVCESGHRWELGEFKLKEDGDIVNMIFSEFKRKIDEYKTAPSQIQIKTVYSPILNKSFQISFTKSTDTRVVGFVKKIEKDEEAYVVMDNVNLLKVTKKYKNLNMEEMYAKLIQWMEEDPEFTKYIFFTFLMMRRSKGDSL
jgi:hypothetical protein